MSNNGSNDWGVSYSRIAFLQKILESHANVQILGRRDDVIFEIQRVRQQDSLTIFCIDAYSASLELVMRIVAAAPSVNVIFVGGKWAGYTQEAYNFCKERKIGIYNAGDLAGGLHKDAYWAYEKFDDKGNSERNIKT